MLTRNFQKHVKSSIFNVFLIILVPAITITSHIEMPFEFLVSDKQEIKNLTSRKKTLKFTTKFSKTCQIFNFQYFLKILLPAIIITSQIEMSFEFLVSDKQEIKYLKSRKKTLKFTTKF